MTFKGDLDVEKCSKSEETYEAAPYVVDDQAETR